MEHAEGVFVRDSVAGQGPLDETNLNLIQSSEGSPTNNKTLYNRGSGDTDASLILNGLSF